MNSSRTQSPSRRTPESMQISGELFTPDADELLPGSMNDEAVIRGLVTDTIRRCNKGRESLAEEMTELLGEKVTARMLNSYTSEAAEKHRWPAQYTRALCHATGDWRLVRCISERCGFHLITKAEAKLFELGRQYLIEKRAAATIAKLERELAEVSL